MPPKSAQRFWENDMHQNKDTKRVARRDALCASRRCMYEPLRNDADRRLRYERAGQPLVHGG
ncbi:MAG: hypothetical protein E5X80_01315 [Mesorhizobium sp.]|nr:MAG: hypothetical protein EOR71_00915 [Mesorhizobium sp.]TIO54975.1 MAG: hypothetical protein E5X78_00915 [Mesorhizobium sp.]TIO62816.1 MAG: hypothetical protein E5X79_00655 [Mesorhizobium sp.]TJV67610.1 MAG: hypothetical protein E5X80_01315 [Mesorhizobium sp.]